METVETRSLPSHLPPQPPRQTGLCWSNENKGASHHRLDWISLKTAECCMQETSWEPSHFTCAENGCWECSRLLVLPWLWAVNSSSSFLGSWTPLFSSISNREKLPCFSKPVPPLPSKRQLGSQKGRYEGCQRGKHPYVWQGRKQSIPVFLHLPQSAVIDLNMSAAVFTGFDFPLSQSTGYSPYCRERAARSHYYTGIISLQVLL